MIYWLIGPSGAGKSTVGRLLAEKIPAQFIDMDRAIESEAGMSVAEIFDKEGEAAFRMLERRLITELPRRFRGEALVVATGGGAIADPRNRDLMRSTGIRILLEVDPAVAVSRLMSGERRPLLDEADLKESWNRLAVRRRRAYADSDLSLNANGLPSEVVEEAVAAFNWVRLPLWKQELGVSAEPSVIIAPPNPYTAIRLARTQTRGRRRCVVTDRNLADIYPDTLKRLAGPKGIVIPIESGEASKSFGTTEQIIERMRADGFGRGDCVIGFGGGVVTDLAGFVAAIYMRGILCLTVPTSLLGMVDASVGGKTAINAAGTRNLVGTFSQPRYVMICTAFLRTLPLREYRSGMVESLKMGLTLDGELLDRVTSVSWSTDGPTSERQVGEIIRESVRAKLSVVREDVQDTGTRGLLNFGHTVGHALEAVHPGVYTHGEAVAFGMIAAAVIATGPGPAKPISDQQAEAIIGSAMPYTVFPSERPDIASILESMEGDKKRHESGHRFVLPERDGEGMTWSVGVAVAGEAAERGIREAWKTIVHYHTGQAE